MKPVRQKKVLGIALGERSLMAAEVVSSGERPQVLRLGEMLYPEGISIFQPAELAKAIAHFLKDNHIGARSAVIGIPLKWLIAKPKEVPPADDQTVADLLRLEAEAEFSTELKDLVYDFAGEEVRGAASRTVLLAAVPKKYMDAIETMCEGARLGLLAVTPSALALGSTTVSTRVSAGEATNGAMEDREVLVLAAGAGGSELSSQRQASPVAVRSLRSPTPQPPFVSELRRAVSTLAPTEKTREMVLWDGAGLDAGSLGQQLGVNVRAGELGSLGVDASAAGVNGQGAKYAAAVALALSVMGESVPGIDFLHSRLAPPRARQIPRWAWLGAVAVICLIALGIFAYRDLSKLQAQVDDAKAKVASQQKHADEAREFLARETLAENWHGGDFRYMSCLRDLDSVIPEDGQTYATSLEIKGITPSLTQQGVSNAPGSNPTGSGAAAPADQDQLLVTLQGHTPNPEGATALASRMNREPEVFKEVKIGPGAKIPRSQEWLFSITFVYAAPKPPAGK